MKFLYLFLFFYVIVIPNSNNTFFLVFFFTITLLDLLLGKSRSNLPIQTIFFYTVISIVFLFFILISPISVSQKIKLFFVYVFAPFLWLSISNSILNMFPVTKVIKISFILSFVATIFAFILYFLTLNGNSIILLFVVEPTITSFIPIGFKLHVYGSLIFFYSSIFLLPKYFNQFFVYIYILSASILALISGRMALLAAFAFGFLLFLFVAKIKLRNKVFVISILVLIVCYINFVISSEFTVSLFEFITEEDNLGKFTSGGGEARVEQNSLLTKHLFENPLGSGFTNVGLVRNDESTFLYENLILSTFQRIGFLGGFLILLSLYFVFLALINFRKIKEESIYFLVGFFSILVFSLSNPYLESIAFQFMFFFPIVYFEKRYMQKNNVLLQLNV